MKRTRNNNYKNKRTKSNVNKATSDKQFNQNMNNGGNSNMNQWANRGQNDPEWYSPSSAVIRDVASVAYGFPTGAKQNLGEYAPQLNRYGVPGIMTLNFMPMFGNIADRTSSINRAKEDFYQYVRHVNSGSANYDSNDLMLYILTVEQLYMWMAYVKRIYRTLSTFAYENTYYPAALTMACGGNYDDLVKHMSDLRAYWNTVAVKINSLAVPKIFPIFDRHMQLVSNVYADGSTAKSQVYVFNPTAVYKYQIDTTTGGCLVPVNLRTLNEIYDNAGVRGVSYRGYCEDPGLRQTFESIVSTTQGLLTNLYNMEDFGIMTGDILKAYGTNNLWQLTPIDINDGITPIVDMEMLNQIQNASMMGWRSGGSITQNGNILSQSIKWRSPYFVRPNTSATTRKYYAPNAFLTKRYLNVDLANVTPEDTMVATRLTNIGSNYNETDGTFEINTHGTEIVEWATIYRYDYSGGHYLVRSRAIFTALCDLLTFGSDWTASECAKSVATVSYTGNLMNQLSNFEYHPAVYNTTVITEVNTATPSFTEYITFDSVAFDLGKYTVVDETNLKEMSDAAVIRLLGMKGI